MCVCVCCGRCENKSFTGGFLIVAALDDTCVEVYAIENGEYRLQQGYFMHQFQVLTYMSHVRNDTKSVPVSQYDATGTYVNSTKPIAVYGGHSCAQVPTGDILFCDHIIEQIPPVAELGTRHVVPPIVGRSNDFAG